MGAEIDSLKHQAGVLANETAAPSLVLGSACFLYEYGLVFTHSYHRVYRHPATGIVYESFTKRANCCPVEGGRTEFFYHPNSKKMYSNFRGALKNSYEQGLVGIDVYQAYKGVEK